MAKLNPPIIQDILPPFTGDLIIPFEYPRSVSAVSEAQVVIKDLSGAGARSFEGTIANKNITIDQSYIGYMTQDQYYKVQVAFVDIDPDTSNCTVGYYTQAALVQKIEEPSITITQDPGNDFEFEVSGDDISMIEEIRCKREGEELKAVYKDGRIYVDIVPIDWPSTNTITWIFTVIYNNLYKKEYDITQSINRNKSGTFELQFEEGYNQITIKPKNLTNRNYYKIFRKTSNNKFLLVGMRNGSSWEFNDTNCNPNENYEYAIGVCVPQIYHYYINNDDTPKTFGLARLTNFDTAILTDESGEVILPLQFDPKVSSFKKNVQEQKSDVLGSKYPIFSRSTASEYYEFPVSALISIRTEHLKGFIDSELENFTKSQYRSGTNETYSSEDTVSEEIRLEKLLKTRVLDWLTNGEVKIFKSPVEPSCKVRLMNVSMTPNDTLGRMIHTFSATAYQVDDGGALNV